MCGYVDVDMDMDYRCRTGLGFNEICMISHVCIRLYDFRPSMYVFVF